MARSVDEPTSRNPASEAEVEELPEPEESRRVSYLPQGIDEPETITKTEFIAKCQDNPGELFEGLLRMWEADQDDKVHRINLAERRTENLRQQLLAREDQITKLITERDEYRDTVAEMTVRAHRECRTTPVPDQPRRTVKLPDPPILTDGKEPKFDDWMAQMKTKLKANADHYSSNLLQVAYVQSRLGGRAAEHAAPRFHEDSVNQYQTADEVFEHLKSIFFDPNRRMTARRQLRHLQMKSYQKYHDFLAEFMHLAGESQLHLEDYKEELFDKLTDELRNLTTRDYHAPGTFDEFSTACSQAAYTLQINAEKSKARSKSYKPAGTALAAESRDKPTTRTAAPAAYKASGLDDKQRVELMREGKCFYCKETGHIAPHCPRKKASEIKTLEETKEEASGNHNSGKAQP